MIKVSLIPLLGIESMEKYLIYKEEQKWSLQKVFGVFYYFKKSKNNSSVKYCITNSSESKNLSGWTKISSSNGFDYNVSYESEGHFDSNIQEFKKTYYYKRVILRLLLIFILYIGVDINRGHKSRICEIHKSKKSEYRGKIVHINL